MTNIVFAGTGNDEFVECAARAGLKPKGRTFKKQILHFGSFAHPSLPGKKVVVDDKFADDLIRNFSDGVCDIVQVPIVDGQNKHTEDPNRNIGAVVDLTKDEKGIYAIIDARDNAYADKLGKTLIGASAMLNLNYTDTRTGARVGPTLLHTAITNRPYITKLDDFEEIVLSHADTSQEETVLLGAATTKLENTSMPMTKEEMIAALKAEHGIDVDALVTSHEETAALSNVLGEETVSMKDVAEAVLELSHKNEEQSAQIAALVEDNNTLKLSAAGAEIDSLIKAGRILPKQRDTMLRLSVEDRETFDALLPEESIVELSESGVTTHQDTKSDKVIADLQRYHAMARGENVE